MSTTQAASVRSPSSDYERDPQFIEYLQSRLDAVFAAKEAGHLIAAQDVFSTIRSEHGWDSGR